MYSVVEALPIKIDIDDLIAEILTEYTNNKEER